MQNCTHYISNINSEIGAYLLGLIAGTGQIFNSSSILVGSIGYNVRPNLLFSVGEYDHAIFDNNKLEEIFNVKINNHDNILEFFNFPNSLEERYVWVFLRGHCDASGYTFVADGNNPGCAIRFKSDNIYNKVKEFCKIPYKSTYGKEIRWEGNNALDFMAKLYEGSKISYSKEYSTYRKICCTVPFYSIPFTSPLYTDKSFRDISFKWSKVDPEAKDLFKERISDSGYDLTLIKKVKDINGVELYDTGINVLPDFGWFFYLFPRSSIIKTGYMLANSIGVIDRTYIGSIKVALIKVQKDLPDLELPARVVQIIPAPILHMNPIQVSSLDMTLRSDGGFGSTG